MSGILNKDGFTRFAPGKEIGTSDWVRVEQQLIDGFGVATLDDDPMHNDPAWARETGPFGQTIAYGFWTMSLLTHLFHGASATAAARLPAEEGYYLNYGIDRLRLINPVPIGGRIRGHFKTKAKRVDDRGRMIVTFDVTVEIEGEPRPALVGEWLAIWVTPT